MLCPISARREDRCPLYRDLNFSPRIGLKIHGWVLGIWGIIVTSPFWWVLSRGGRFVGFSGICGWFVVTFVVFYIVYISDRSEISWVGAWDMGHDCKIVLSWGTVQGGYICGLFQEMWVICSDFCGVCIDFVMTFVVFSDVYIVGLLTLNLYWLLWSIDFEVYSAICDDFCSLLW
jgi:hypothetical protein